MRERKYWRLRAKRGKGKESERSERQDQKGCATGLAAESFEPWPVGSSYISPERPCCFFNARTTSTHGNCGRKMWRCFVGKERKRRTRGEWRVLGGLRRKSGPQWKVHALAWGACSQDDRMYVTIDWRVSFRPRWHRIRGDRSWTERYDRSMCREARNWEKKVVKAT